MTVTVTNPTIGTVNDEFAPVALGHASALVDSFALRVESARYSVTVWSARGPTVSMGNNVDVFVGCHFLAFHD